MKNIIPLLAACLFALGQAPADAAKRPNILFMMSDDHASEAISAYGSWLKDYCHTPTLDRLAAEGMRDDHGARARLARASRVAGQA